MDRAALVLGLGVGGFADGVVLLNRRPPLPNSVLWGGILAGWGVFDLVEGIVDHQVLGVHHVREGPHQLAYDLGFLALGAVLVATGALLGKRPRLRRQPEGSSKSRTRR